MTERHDRAGVWAAGGLTALAAVACEPPSPEAAQTDENARAMRLGDSVTRRGSACDDGRAWRAAVTPDATNARP